MTTAVQATLDAHHDSWLLFPPPEPELLNGVVSGAAQPMPEALRQFFQLSDGGGSHAVTIFSLDEWREMCRDALHARLPGAVFFAKDTGEGVFLIDQLGTLDGESGAVYWVPV